MNTIQHQTPSTSNKKDVSLLGRLSKGTLYWFICKIALLGAATITLPVIIFNLTARYQLHQGLIALIISSLVAVVFLVPLAWLIYSARVFIQHYEKLCLPPSSPRHTIQMLGAYIDPFKALMDSTKDSVYLLDRDGRFLFVNKTHLDRLGLQEDEVLGRYYQDLHTMEDWAHTELLLNRALRNNTVIEEDCQNRDDGGYYLRTLAPVEDDKGRLSAVLVTSKDISERHQFEDRMKAWAMQDELTGLLNRRGFLLFAQQQQSVAKRLDRRMLLIFADMDNLKMINDSFGHEYGDIAIRETAQILRDTFRKSDIIARLGGDEFVVLAFETTTGYAETLQERLLHTTQHHNAQNDRIFKISVSTGIVIWDPASADTIEDMLVTADKLMYEQKMKKKNKK
jgi:diguanylate cyclase (GGDEF)-like protein/PAS domain S-box-containing protein